MKLSEHFSLEELTFSQTAVRNGWDNLPNADALANLHRLAAMLEEIRAFIKKPINISSGYRSKRVNTAVGSKETSQHRTGQAADIKVSGMSAEQLMRAIIQAGVGYDQLILEFANPDGTGGWVHISISAKDKEPRGEKLIIDRFGVRLYDD